MFQLLQNAKFTIVKLIATNVLMAKRFTVDLTV